MIISAHRFFPTHWPFLFFEFIQFLKFKKKNLFILGFWSSCEANFSEFDTHAHLAQLKTPSSKRQSSWIFIKCDGYDSGIAQDKPRKWSEGDLNPDLPHANPAPWPLSHAASRRYLTKKSKNKNSLLRNNKRIDKYVSLATFEFL